MNDRFYWRHEPFLFLLSFSLKESPVRLSWSRPMRARIASVLALCACLLAADPPPAGAPGPAVRQPDFTVARVDALIAPLRIHVYEPPPHLADALALTLQPQKRWSWAVMETDLLLQLRRMAARGRGCRFVSDPARADFFWVPSTLHAHADPTAYWRRALGPFVRHIVRALPYFNRSRGHDHIFFWTLDNGPICDPTRARFYLSDEFRALMWPMLHLGYYGRVSRRPPGAPRSKSLHPLRFSQGCVRTADNRRRRGGTQGFFRIIKNQGGGDPSPKTPSPPPQSDHSGKKRNHLEERLLDQVQARASYTPLFWGRSRSIPQCMVSNGGGAGLL